MKSLRILAVDLCARDLEVEDIAVLQLQGTLKVDLHECAGVGLLGLIELFPSVPSGVLTIK